MQHRRFTLIEMMFVVGVVFVLILLLLSALTTTHKKAKYGRWNAYTRQVCNDGRAVLFYPMEEGLGEKLGNRAIGADLEGSTQECNDGTRGSAATWTRDGCRFDQKPGLYFTGSDNSTVSSTQCSFGSAAFKQGLTMIAWVRPEALANDDNVILYLSGGAVGETGYDGEGNSSRPIFEAHIGITSDGRIRACYQNGPYSAEAAALTTDAPVVSKLDDWYHIAVTYAFSDDRTCQARIAVNGNTVKTQTIAFSAPVGGYHAQRLYLGRVGDDNASHGFRGTIDEVLVFGVPVSDEDISAHLRMGQP